MTRRITREEAKRLGALAWFVWTPSGIVWCTNVRAK